MIHSQHSTEQLSIKGTPNVRSDSLWSSTCNSQRCFRTLWLTERWIWGGLQTMNCSSRMLVLLPACSSVRLQQLGFHISLPQVDLGESAGCFFPMGYSPPPRVLFSLIWSQSDLLQILTPVFTPVCYRDQGLSRQGSQIPLSSEGIWSKVFSRQRSSSYGILLD